MRAAFRLFLTGLLVLATPLVFAAPDKLLPVPEIQVHSVNAVIDGGMLNSRFKSYDSARYERLCAFELGNPGESQVFALLVVDANQNHGHCAAVGSWFIRSPPQS